MSSPRRRVTFVLPTLALLLLGGAATVTTTAQAADPKAAIANGRKLYMSVGCYQCHGTVGQGGSAGPRLGPGPMPLEALRAFIRNTSRVMPTYPASILADAAVEDIHAYLQSIPPAPPAETIPLLRAVR